MAKKKKEKKSNYLKEVRSEMKKVEFPKFKEVVKYTIATIIMVAVLIGLFELVLFLLSLLNEAV